MFVGAAAPVGFGTVVCGLGSVPRLVARVASGRQRFHVRGAWNAVTRPLITVTTTTVVNTETLSARFRKSAAVGWIGPLPLVLDKARSHHHAAVKARAEQRGITLLFRPASAPTLNRIARWWKVIQRRVRAGRSHPTYADVQAAIQEPRDSLPTPHAAQLKTLMTLNFQRFEDVSLRAA